MGVEMAVSWSLLKLNNTQEFSILLFLHLYVFETFHNEMYKRKNS